MEASSSYRLVVRRGPQPNQVYELNKGIVTIGRDITNDIVINDPEVSRHHCRLTQTGSGYTVEDLGSTNGTFVNGQRLTGQRALTSNDMLGLGETVTLAYEAQGASTAAAMEPREAPTMTGPAAPESGADYAPQQQQDYGYVQPEYGQQGYSAPAGGAPDYQGVPVQPQAAPYGYEYQDEAYDEGGGITRWLLLGCGCFLVLCIVTGVVGGIIVDVTCSWDNLGPISETFNLGVKEDATCR